AISCTASGTRPVTTSCAISPSSATCVVVAGRPGARTVTSASAPGSRLQIATTAESSSGSSTALPASTGAPSPHVTSQAAVVEPTVRRNSRRVTVTAVQPIATSAAGAPESLGPRGWIDAAGKLRRGLAARCAPRLRGGDASRREAGHPVALVGEQIEHAARADQVQRADRDEAAAAGVEPLDRRDPRRAAIVEQIGHLVLVLGVGVAVAQRLGSLGGAEREDRALVAGDVGREQVAGMLRAGRQLVEQHLERLDVEPLAERS